MWGARHVKRLLGDKAVRDHDRVQAVLVSRLGAVEDVLEPDGGLVVGPGHALAVVVGGQHGEVADGQVAQVAGGLGRVGVAICQFWQWRQAKLQPTLPSESTVVPGKKW